MLKDYIVSTIQEELGYEPTKGQKQLVQLCADFIMNKGAEELLIINGYAGTGKTSMISALVRGLYQLKLKSVLLAPTGRAAKVLSSFSGQNAYTVHKKIYRLQSAEDGFGSFVLDKNLHTNTFFIVDEASMISNQPMEYSKFGSGYLLDDLLSYVYNQKNCKLILVGDVAQLPPVGLNMSPALDPETFRKRGYEVHVANLTEVIRQAESSGILENATSIRQMIADQVEEIPAFQMEPYTDIANIPGDELVEAISDAYDTYGMDQTIVINRSNKRANTYNQGIRNQILWREEEIAHGDFLMVVKNNYYWLTEEDDIDFIANGDIAEILQIHDQKELYGYRFAEVTLRLIDYEDLEFDTVILLDTLYLHSASLSREAQKAFFYTVLEDYADIRSKKKRYQKVKDNPYFNALQVKFAYAITCHKAQGGQWDVVFVDQGYITEEMISTEYLRWLYTALTRANKKVYLVNFPSMFFEEA